MLSYFERSLEALVGSSLMKEVLGATGSTMRPFSQIRFTVG